jgi:hypothetical protein
MMWPFAVIAWIFGVFSIWSILTDSPNTGISGRTWLLVVPFSIFGSIAFCLAIFN